ncbi:MAG: hypothetical protein AUG04_11925 [Deltaproteobacteria bacterium 13_1_20CM_2_69_21]|nr:MAG: hypothetical protein AUI48_13140 [Chloroflexi bacterium 13_1_40CM_2_68_14]OLE62039.1 MAG: hypothetical protein AUG04_11925 [Deltaproteobacteria bacterium 13_1_20CM_2_69_21]
MRQIFRRLSSIIVFVIGPAFAAGTAYYITSRVAITGLYDWSVLQQSTLYQNTYRISASYSPLGGVSISGDQQFTIDGSACSGVQSCSAIVSFVADVGGDYVATIAGASSSRLRVRGSSTAYPVKAHVVGANYTLIGVDNGDATATFTLTSAGEADLISPTFAASTWNNVGTATIMTDTCGDSVPSGTSCQITVAFTFNADEAASAYGYILLQASGNTRQQAPVRLTLLLPPKD